MELIFNLPYDRILKITKEFILDYLRQITNAGFKFVNNEKKVKLSYAYSLICPNNHMVLMRLDNIIRALNRNSPSKGCRECHEEECGRISLETTKSYLPEGFSIVGSYRKDVDRKEMRTTIIYQLKCNKGHKFIKERGQLQELSCTVCSKIINVGQERTRKIFEHLFEVPFNSIQPDWLKNPSSKRNLELDGYNKDLNIAFEFQGRQHSSADTQFRDDYEMQIARDKLKRELCKQHGINLIEIHQPPSYKHVKFVDDVLEQIKQNINIKDYPHIDFNINKSQFNFKDISIVQMLPGIKNFFDYLQNESPIKGYSCITNDFHTYEDKITMCCPEGHNYETTAAEFKRNAEGKKGRNIPCTTCNKEENKVNTIIDLTYCREEGKKHGLELLSTDYVNVNEELEWKDSNGKTIKLPFRKLQRRKLVKKPNTKGIDLAYCREKGKEFGLELLSTEYINVHTELEWKDSNGETVKLYLRQLQRSKKNEPKPKTGITVDLCREEGRKYGLELLSNDYKNITEKLLWKKENGDEVELSLRQIQRTKTGIF
jgi:hypothetical protein